MDRDQNSIAMVLGPSMEIEVDLSLVIIDKLHPYKYRIFIQEDYIQHISSRKFEGRKNIEFAKISS